MTSPNVLKRTYAPRLPPEQRREQLLDAALALVARQGYGAVTMQDVAQGAGVAKPVLYEMFGNRGELLHALIEREERRALEQVAEALPDEVEGRSPEQVFAEAVRAFLEAVIARPDSWRVLLLPVEGTPPGVQERFGRARAGVLAQVQEFAEWGMNQRPGGRLDPELLGHTMISLAEMAARLALTDPDGYPIDRLAGFLTDIARAVQRG